MEDTLFGIAPDHIERFELTVDGIGAPEGPYVRLELWPYGLKRSMAITTWPGNMAEIQAVVGLYQGTMFAATWSHPKRVRIMLAALARRCCDRGWEVSTANH